MPKRKPSRPKSSPPPIVYRDAAPLPDWFAPAVVAGGKVSRPCPQYSIMSPWTFVEECERGEFALPPWQRGDVWSLEQRVALLDSMARGLRMGPITVWKPYGSRNLGPHPVPLCGSPINPMRCGYVLDGRQRLTTILMAARGELPVRWSGERWHDGPGIATIEQVIPDTSFAFDHFDSVRQHAHDSWAELMRLHKQVSGYRLEFVLYETDDLDAVVENYRLLATCGTAHGIEDLEAVERWLAERATSART
jgi:hypothetical protein